MYINKYDILIDNELDFIFNHIKNTDHKNILKKIMIGKKFSYHLKIFY